MIKGFIKANNEGFKNTDKQKGIENVILSVKSDRPTKFKKRQIAFYDTNFKNPAPTSFSPQSIKEDTVYGPKEFNAKINYTEDPFRELFGYTKRINPDDHLNPKYYEFKLGNKNENSYIIENLQAENGTATNDVEQREALKDFLELRRLQEIADKEHEYDKFSRKPMVDAIAGKRANRRASKVGGIPGEEEEVPPPNVTIRGRNNRKDKKRGIKPERAFSPEVPPKDDKFKEFEEKTNIGNFHLIGGKVPFGDVPRKGELLELFNKAANYMDGTSKDRSAVIKVNKYLKKVGMEPLTGKEQRPDIVLAKAKQLIKKLHKPELGARSKVTERVVAVRKSRLEPEERGGLSRLRAEEELRHTGDAIEALTEKIGRGREGHERAEDEAYRAMSKGMTPRRSESTDAKDDIRGFLRTSEKTALQRFQEQREEAEKRIKESKDKTLKSISARKMARAGYRADRNSAFRKWKDMTEASRRDEQSGILEATVNPEAAGVKDTKRIRESLGAPGKPDNKQLLVRRYFNNITTNFKQY